MSEFGTNSASEMFQHVVSEQIKDIPGVMNVSVDLVVYGKTREEHNQALEATFKRLSSIGLTLNESKCKFNQSSISFYGLVFSATRKSPDPEKVKAIHDALPPESASEVQSFLGMVTYYTKFIPNFSDVTTPLRELTKKDVQFVWGDQQQLSFKELLTSDTVMAYFDKVTEDTTDASLWGLSAILTQHTAGQSDHKVLAFVSLMWSSDIHRQKERHWP